MLNRPGQARPPASRRKSAVSAAEAAAAQADAARVDYGRLENSLGYVLRRAQLAVFKTFQHMFKSLDITPAQCSVLLIIEKNPGLTQTQVSDALGIKRANFVALFDTLEARGLAERAPATDRRSYALQLTPRGRALLRKIHSISDLHEEKISSPLTKQERAELFRMLNLLVAPGEPGDDDGA
jgi:DNA-binding MarR family transcriptional regulator